VATQTKREVVAEAFGVRSVDQLPTGLRVTAENAIEEELRKRRGRPCSIWRQE